LIAWHV
jgi:CO/xanthine dehydrogenase Mo-binding subunit